MIEKCKKNGTYEKERRQLENIFADTTYQDQVDMLRESVGDPPGLRYLETLGRGRGRGNREKGPTLVGKDPRIETS